MANKPTKETYKEIFEQNFDVIKKAQGVLARANHPNAENNTKAVNALERAAKLADSYEGEEFWGENRWAYLMALSSDVVNNLVLEAYRITELEKNPSLIKEYRALQSKESVIELRDEFKEREESLKESVQKPLDELNQHYRQMESFISVARGYVDTIEEAEEKIDEYEKRQAAAMTQGR